MRLNWALWLLRKIIRRWWKGERDGGQGTEEVEQRKLNVSGGVFPSKPRLPAEEKEAVWGGTSRDHAAPEEDWSGPDGSFQSHDSPAQGSDSRWMENTSCVETKHCKSGADGKESHSILKSPNFAQDSLGMRSVQQRLLKHGLYPELRWEPRWERWHWIKS